MKNIFFFLSKIGKDKLLHFFYGFILMVILLLLLPKIFAIITVVSMAFLKELIDKITGGTVELLDIFFTCLPLSILLIVK